MEHVVGHARKHNRGATEGLVVPLVHLTCPSPTAATRELLYDSSCPSILTGIPGRRTTLELLDVVFKWSSKE